jgi:hypothetical protein
MVTPKMNVSSLAGRTEATKVQESKLLQQKKALPVELVANDLQGILGIDDKKLERELKVLK